MNDKQFQRLLDKAVKSAIEHRELMEQVGKECIERYGYLNRPEYFGDSLS